MAALASLRQPLTAGERQVVDLFERRLPPGWEIYIQPHLNGLRPDFVLLNPDVGIGVFEVKDWDLDAMRYFTKKGDWGPELWAEKDGRSFCIQGQNPVAKANLYRKEIFDLYCPRIAGQAGWAAITAGVIFPFAKADRAKALLSPFIVADNDRYSRYQPISGIEAIAGDDISAVFPEAGRSGSRLMSDSLAQDLRGWLVEPDFASAQRSPLVLDRNQRPLAETRTDTGYRRIKGPAGSGKSLVLAARAARLANQDKSVLVATFNITLWHYLRDLIVRDLDAPEKIRNIRFTHFHLWCKHVCHEVGWGARYDALWRRHSPDYVLDTGLALLASDAVQQPDAIEYDAILVDEGQDYLPLWWNTLRKACRPGGEMLLVADATQDVYGTASSWTDDAMKGAGFRGDWSRLNVSYRLPPAALSLARDYASAFLPKDVVDLPEPEQGSLDLFPCHLRWVQCDQADAEEICADEAARLMLQTGANGLANADITVLTADMAIGGGIVRRLSKRGIRAVDTFGPEHRRKKMGFYMGDASVKATTLHSFKGWEARLLVVCITDARDPRSLALAYAGLTRLKRSSEGSWLTVICSAPKLDDFGHRFQERVDRRLGSET